MIPFLMTVLVIVAIALVGVILMQKSEGGVLGIGGGSKFGGMMTGVAAGDFLTKATNVLAIAFFVISFILSLMVYKQNGGAPKDGMINVEEAAPASADKTETKPTVPLAK